MIQQQQQGITFTVVVYILATAQLMKTYYEHQTTSTAKKDLALSYFTKSSNCSSKMAWVLKMLVA